MIPRVVYDTMIFVQWFGLPDDRQHGSLKLVLADRVRLLLSHEQITEIRDVLCRPNLRAKMPSLTDETLDRVLNSILIKAELLQTPAAIFTLREHPDDDHIFNLAIAGQAEFLVTWENRILGLVNTEAENGKELRRLAPQLAILNPIDFVAELERRETGA